MVDLQRAYANALRAGPAMVLDNKMPATSDPSNPAEFGGGAAGDPGLGDNPGIKLEQSEAFEMPMNPDSDPTIGGSAPVRKLMAKDLRGVTAPMLARNLFAEETALVPAALAAIRDCDAAGPSLP